MASPHQRVADQAARPGKRKQSYRVSAASLPKSGFSARVWAAIAAGLTEDEVGGSEAAGRRLGQVQRHPGAAFCVHPSARVGGTEHPRAGHGVREHLVPPRLSPSTPVPLFARPATPYPVPSFCPYTPLASELLACPYTPFALTVPTTSP